MFELIIPFVLPSLGAALAWIIGFPKYHIIGVFVSILLLQFSLLGIKYFYQELYRKKPLV
jgi:hypothetical protein